MQTKKFTKKEVQYEHPAKGPNHCGICHYFTHYQRTIFGECDIVQGIIQGKDWCNQFKPIKGENR